MSNEIQDPAAITTPPSKLAKLKRWWPTLPIAAIAIPIVAWLAGETKPKPVADMPLTIVYSALQTNWEATVSSSHDPRLPVAVLTLTNGTLATNMINLNVRRAEIYRMSLLGFRKPDGGILPIAQAAVRAGTIVQTNGVDSVVLTEFTTSTNK